MEDLKEVRSSVAHFGMLISECTAWTGISSLLQKLEMASLNVICFVDGTYRIATFRMMRPEQVGLSLTG